MSSFIPIDFQKQKDFNKWKADKRLTVCHFRESLKGSRWEPLNSHTELLGGFFSVNHDSWAAESRGDSHSYSWLRQGNHISEGARKCLWSRASAQSFTTGQQQLTPHFLAEKQPGREVLLGYWGTIMLPCLSEQLHHDERLKRTIKWLTYRKLDSPLHTSKGACMPPVWVQSMSRWSFCPARWK